MSLRAEDSRKLLVKLVGTENILEQQKLTSFFRAFLMSRVKTYIAQVMKSKKINIFEIDERLTEFSEDIRNSARTLLCDKYSQARRRASV